MTTNITESQVTKYSSDDNVVLSVQGVSKKFCRSLKRSLFYGVQDIASELVGVRKENNQLRKGEFWALQDVSFELKKGESLGLVGANGSGKTTLLRIISGLIKPDTGSVKITGRVAPLIALGAGFNPILTGRENIYVNMSILGLSKEEIDERFDEVVDFAEIGDAIDAPVQTYSSGMAARLGFACAIHTEPDILLIDEVLAVGDFRFRQKCYRKLSNLSNNSVSFILVSHNINSILSVCKDGLYLSKEKKILLDNIHSVIKCYEDSFYSKTRSDMAEIILPQKNKNSGLGIDILRIYFADNNLKKIQLPITGNQTYLCVGLKVYKEIQNVGLTLLIKEQLLGKDYNLRLSSFNDSESFRLMPGEHEIQIQMPYFCLKPGSYTMKLSISEGELYLYDAVESFKFSVTNPGGMSQCSFYQPRYWKVIQNNLNESDNYTFKV